MRPDCTPTNGLGLTPTIIVALGMPDAPVDRLMGLQSAVGRLIDWLAALRLPARRVQTACLRLRPTHQGEL